MVLHRAHHLTQVGSTAAAVRVHPAVCGVIWKQEQALFTATNTHTIPKMLAPVTIGSGAHISV